MSQHSSRLAEALLFRPVSRQPKPWSGRVLVLSPGAIPTVDYYLSSRLGGLDPAAVRHANSLAAPDDDEKPQDGTFVIIVRHSGPKWLEFLASHRERWAGVALLMDDDIPGAWRCGDAPLDYRLWTSGRYLRVRHLLARVCDRLWFSTEALRSRYASIPSILVPPLPCTAPRQASAPGCRRWAYHGTRVHGRELRWLVPLVDRVQRAVPEAEFEVFGNGRARRLFDGIPRVTVVPPMPWPAYLNHCASSDLAIGLAPLLPGPFNAVRSHTKLFDIARCGAVGLYSDRAPYSTSLAGSGSMLLPDDHGAWAQVAIRLLQDDPSRLARYEEAAQWVAEQVGGNDLAALIHARNA